VTRTLNTTQRLEYLDVVDAQNRVMGCADRPLIHRLGLRHRAVHVLIFNRQGQVFVQLRSLQKKSDPGLWDSSVSGTRRPWRILSSDSVTGDAGGSGCCSQSFVYGFVLPAQRATGYEFSYVYQSNSDGPMILQREEISDGRWLDPARLTQELATAPQQFSSSLQLIWIRWLHRHSCPSSTMTYKGE